MSRYNLVRRVPTLVLDNGEVVIESTAILNSLDEVSAAKPPLIAARGDGRRRALKVCALANGLADKAISLIYGRVFHTDGSKAWNERCEGLPVFQEISQAFVPPT